MYDFCTRETDGVFEVRSVVMWHGHTNDFPSTAVTIRKAMTLHQQDARMPVREAQKQRPDPQGQNANATVSTYKFWCCAKIIEVQEDDNCVVCAVWVFSPPARTSACRGSLESLKLCAKTIVETIFQSTATTHPTTDSSTSRLIETTTKKMGVHVALPAGGYLLLSSVSAPIH